MATEGFNWSDLWAPLITSGVQLAGGLFANSVANDQAKDARQQALDDRAYQERQGLLAFEREKELAAFRASLAGSATPFLGFTGPQKVSALQQQDQNNLTAIQQLISAYQRGLGK